MAVSDSEGPAFSLTLGEDLLPLPIVRKEMAERKLLTMLSGDHPRKRGRRTGRQAAIMATPISSMAQNMRVLTTPVPINRHPRRDRADGTCPYHRRTVVRQHLPARALTPGHFGARYASRWHSLTCWAKSLGEESHASDTASNSATTVSADRRFFTGIYVY